MKYSIETVKSAASGYLDTINIIEFSNGTFELSIHRGKPNKWDLYGTFPSFEEAAVARRKVVAKYGI